jgi:hypothetical protein
MKTDFGTDFPNTFGKDFPGDFPTARPSRFAETEPFDSPFQELRLKRARLSYAP